MTIALCIIGAWLAFNVLFALGMYFKPLPARTLDDKFKLIPEVDRA